MNKELEDFAKDLDNITEQVACSDPSPQDEWVMDYNYVRYMREGNLVKRQFTLTEVTEEAWTDFMLTYSGVAPTRGKGISSAMAEFCLRLGMGIIADFMLEKLAEDFKQIVPNEHARMSIKRNIERLASML